ncbi:MAG: hypothetical protein AB7O65_07705, partial [Candidatus Korobacteraceae bacterium]
MSRIHDALRRAEQSLRNGNNGAHGPLPDADTTDQALEILEVLRVTEQAANAAESEEFSSDPLDFDLTDRARSWQAGEHRAPPIADAPPGFLQETGLSQEPVLGESVSVSDVILDAGRTAAETDVASAPA